MRALVFAAMLSAGCGGGLLQAGAICNTSSECAAGLVCDHGPTPHVCAAVGSIPRDMSVPADDMATPVDFAGLDLLGVDLSVPPQDLSQVMDLSGPD